MVPCVYVCRSSTPFIPWNSKVNRCLSHSGFLFCLCSICDPVTHWLPKRAARLTHISVAVRGRCPLEGRPTAAAVRLLRPRACNARNERLATFPVSGDSGPRCSDGGLREQPHVGVLVPPRKPGHQRIDLLLKKTLSTFAADRFVQLHEIALGGKSTDLTEDLAQTSAQPKLRISLQATQRFIQSPGLLEEQL